LALPLEKEDEKPKIGGPTKNQSQTYQQANAKHKKTKNKKSTLMSYRAHTLGKGEWSRKYQLSKLESLSPS
jgi:hypothetical protein